MAFYLKCDGPLKHLDTDFVIVSQTGKEIPCHKFVLALKSPVFDAMFDMKDSKEVVEGRIEIPNVSDEALQAMVNFIYSEKLDDDVVCQDLLVLANKYNLEILVKNILPEIISNVDVDNCLEAYAFGIVHKYDNLKISAFSVIAFNWEILQHDGEMKLKTLEKEHPKEYETLMMEMKNLGSSPSCSLEVNFANCIDAYVFGLKYAAFVIIKEHFCKIQTSKFELRLKKMAENYPNEHKTLKRKIDQLTYLKVKYGLQCRLELSRKLENNQKDVEIFKELMTYKLSPELCDIVGMEISTPEQCKEKLIRYVYSHKLIDPGRIISKRYIIPDQKLAKVFGSDPFPYEYIAYSDAQKIHCGRYGLAMSPSPHFFEIFRENESPNWLELTRPVKLSKELADIVGVKEASPVEIFQKVWKYVKENKLLIDSIHILPDNKLDKVLICEKDSVTGYAIWDDCKIRGHP